MVDEGEVTERRQVRALSVFGARADETNWSRSDTRDEQFVVENCRPAFLIWVDLDVFLLKGSPVVVGAVTEFPVRVDGLGHVPCGGSVPWLAG